jgi:hypothetical protein
MPRTDKPLKKKAVKKPTKKSVSVKVSKPKSRKIKPVKNTTAYFECLNACCQKGIKPKNISQVSHECKVNALVVSKKMSAQKNQAVKKIKQGYAQLGKGLNEFIKSK